MFGRHKIAVIVSEFLGTAVLASAVLSMAGRSSFPFYYAVVAVFTLISLNLALGNTSGAHFNPAVTIGLWTIRQIQTLRAIVYIAAQVLGGAVAWKMNEYFLGQTLRHSVGWGVNWKVMLAEAVGAMVFTFGLASTIYQGFTGLKRAVAVGTAYSTGILVAVIASTGLINPAVAIGVNSWNWAYALGPILGAVVGMNLYSLLFATSDVRAAASTSSVVTVSTAKSSTVSRSTAKKPLKAAASSRKKAAPRKRR